MTDEPEMRTWWVLFPLYGITLADRRPDLARPLFGDATLLNVAHIPILERQVRRAHGRAFGLIDFVHLAARHWEFTTYLAVCRRAPETVTDDDAVYDQLITVAKERAEHIVAALSIVVFIQRTDGRTISLLERHYQRIQSLTILDLEQGESAHSMSGMHGARTISKRESVVLSRQELRSWRRDPQLSGMWTSMMLPKSDLPRSLRNAVTQACVRLADGFTSPSLPAQLLASVTALEILLTYTNQGTGFAGVEQRVRAILGPTWSDRLQLTAVLQARHKYVHQGQRIRDDDLVLSSLMLTIATILVYVQGMSAFHDKNALLAYLDIVTAARAIQDENTSRPLVRIRPVFDPLPNDLPMFQLLTTFGTPDVRFYRD